MMMMSLLEKHFHSLNQHSREKAMMQRRMVRGRKEVKSKESSKEREKQKEKEGKNPRMIIMPPGRFLMLRGLFISRSWRIVKGR